MSWIIDPPPPLASVEEWREFRLSMEKALEEHPGDLDLLEHIEMAREAEAEDLLNSLPDKVRHQRD